MVLLAFATAALLGGRLTRLTELRLRLVWLVATAFAVQILIVNVIPGAFSHDVHAAIHIATYVAIAVAVCANLRVPGMWLIALGGVSNAIAIVANAGVMPASEGALERAGMTPDPEAFTNSGLVEDARLAFLGDVFAIPAQVPAANVFSVGDLLLIAGAFVLVHRVSGSRAPWRRRSGPALVLFDARGAIEAVTPEAGVVLRRLARPGVPCRLGVGLPPEAYVVAGRARAQALGRGGPEAAEARLLDVHGRPVTLTASCLDSGPRVALALATA